MVLSAKVGYASHQLLSDRWRTKIHHVKLIKECMKALKGGYAKGPVGRRLLKERANKPQGLIKTFGKPYAAL